MDSDRPNRLQYSCDLGLSFYIWITLTHSISVSEAIVEFTRGHLRQTETLPDCSPPFPIRSQASQSRKP